ncbi:MAG: arginyltransferase [Rhodospirillales bacterium RIFCSPLOWO2_12_FULL_58_28]|nr:MAG: arginyltransferase [Rhodospirillales bacterium RIFCSPLOWO2_02_FULL_58_16]OHC77260.1 MAG: arginyltransferase [Rhodospirillales bacterium RIFCSPLOWO2_12_FULL_58_28]
MNAAKHKSINRSRFFFTTASLPCPYLPGRDERRVVTELVGRDAASTYSDLSLAGYRRSHAIAYVPACPECEACAAVRVPVAEFKPSRSQRRIWKLNDTLRSVEMPAAATKEQFELFSAYQQSRHGDGDMVKMTYFDYQAMIEDTPVETSIIEFRDPELKLVAACLIDRVRHGLSAVYSFFDPAHGRQSLGVYMVLWILRRAKEQGLDYAYLGFWIKDCPKMSYKAAFHPLQTYSPEGWRTI